ncbi:hypothetical protein BGZ80_010669 [Entomortierella chlamydospora]|uniref:Galactose oxidase n=1 Tax=Entomortierella chlamydospora TaxID=101097 RepID=A0A9P6MUM7_9FUNG|nr:hypothetical protein BGZ79_003986 [Entomortierella chlamydospora]KAG0014066.1 hypothetical protein BGZ80_010669 [Entomortierella chlamydospora]
MAFTKVDTKFFIQGGFSNGNFTSQFVDLELSASWTTSSPIWDTLPTGGPLVSHHTMVYVAPEHAAALGTGKKGYLLTIGGSAPPTLPSFWNTYDLDSGTWAARNFSTPYQALEGHTAVSSPTTGLVYIIGGFWNVTNTVPVAPAVNNSITIFNPVTGTIVHQSLASPQESLTDASAVWSNVTNTILVFGGSRAASNLLSLSGLDMANVIEYDPVSFSSTRRSTTGNIPTRVLDHCTAISDDGSMVVVFGGSTDSKTTSDDLFVLNLGNNTWKQGASASMRRTRMSCGFHSNQFFAWGGSSDQNSNTMHDVVPIVYDIAHNAWTDRYYADGPPSSNPSGQDNPDAPDKKTSLAAIIGGAVGAAVLIGCIAAFILYRRKRRDQKNKAEDDDDNRINRHARAHEARRQRYSAVGAIDDSDIDGSNYINERPLSNIPSLDHYATAAALQRPYHGGNVQSGYWDNLGNYQGPDAQMRPLSGTNVALAENMYDDPLSAAGVYGGPIPASPPPMQWQQQSHVIPQHNYGIPQQSQDFPLQSQGIPQQSQIIPQQIQGLQQSSLQQQQWGNYAPASYYYGSSAEDPRISMVSQGHAPHAQITGASPQSSTGGYVDHNSVRDSNSNFSDTKTNSSTRNPQSITPKTPITNNYIPPPPHHT